MLYSKWHLFWQSWVFFLWHNYLKAINFISFFIFYISIFYYREDRIGYDEDIIVHKPILPYSSMFVLSSSNP